MSEDIDEQLTSWTSQYEKDGSDVLAKAYDWELYDQIRSLGIYPYFHALDENQGPVARYDGREVLMFGSNNYLGLTTHPRVRAAAKDAVDRYGTSMTGSRFVNGTLKTHEELEAKLAHFLGKQAGLVFTTGYQANLGVLTALINKSSLAIADKFAHASVHDGCRLTGGETRIFKHNDLQDLNRVIDETPKGMGALVVVDGVYSMEGDLAILPEIVKTCRERKLRLAVDDAHGLGVLGLGGRGTCHELGVNDQVDLIIGTFSKSLASIGGFVVGDQKVIDFIKHFGRPMIFSASLSPSSVAAAATSLDILIEQPELATRVRENAAYFRQGLTHVGYHVGQSTTAVVPIHIGDSMTTFFIWKDLLDAGVYTNPILYPAVAKDKAMLRTSCMATQSKEQLDRALEVFHKVGKNYNIGQAA